MKTKHTFYPFCSASLATTRRVPFPWSSGRNWFAAVSVLLIGLFAAVPLAQATGGKNLRVIGLTEDGVLVRFHTATPGNTKDIGLVNGFQGTDTSLIGMDFRVQDGLLYGVGNTGGLYTIDTKTAAVTFQNYTVNPGPRGTYFGVDFNPAANALRIVSDTGQNLRVPFVENDPQATVDDSNPATGPKPLTYAALNPPLLATGITGAAYTNNDVVDTTGTTLFVIDTANVAPGTDPQDVVAVLSPANSGSIVTAGSLTVDAGPQAGFDIYSEIRNGVVVGNRGYASLLVNGRYRLYRINMLTGSAKPLGAFYRSSGLDPAVIDIAIRLNQ